MLSEFFKLRGGQYQVETADNGAVALDKYSKFKPAVVVLDLAMPVMSGDEALTKLLKLDKEAVVIISSASGSKEDIEYYLHKGASGFITKPVSPQKVLEKIQDVLIFSKRGNELVILFNLVTDQTQAALRSLLGTNVSLVMKDVETISSKQANVSNSSFTSSKTMRVPEIEDPIHVEVASTDIAVVTDFEGRINGSVISVIDNDDFYVMIHKNNTTIRDQEDFFEFFNIINSKVVAQLADSTHFKLNYMPPRPYEKEEDSRVEGKELTKVSYEITIMGRTIPFVEYLWCNIVHLFKNGF